MDWIERLFNVSPDGGDGTLEALVTIVVVAAALVLIASMRPGGRRWLARIRAAFVSMVTGRARRTGARP